MSFIIRSFTAEDYEGYAWAFSAAHGDPMTAETLRWHDDHFDPKVKRQRWVAQAGTTIVGSAEYYQRIRAYHPQRFEMSLGVHPAYRGRGIGAALYKQLLAGLAEHDPISLTCRTREDWAEPTGFLERRGFVETQRTWESHLDVKGVDLSRFKPQLEYALAQGYTIHNLTELQALPGWDEELYNLVTEVRWDVPSDEPRTASSFEGWKATLSSKHVWPEGFLVAAFAGKLVGVSHLWHTDTEGVVNTGLTGVVREHRGTGVAKALKVRGIQVAREAGFRTIRTWNESNNRRMLAINAQLGFQRKPAWVTYKCAIGKGVSIL